MADNGLTNAWQREFEIFKVHFASEFGETPEDLGWNLDCVWTGWETYSTEGGYAVPGYFPFESDEEEKFVLCWYLGRSPARDDATPIPLNHEKWDCEYCETNGCKECNYIGWTFI
jgi:hypothetical protein